jgi:hypothetical protein
MPPYFSTKNALDATPQPTVDDALALARVGFPIIPLAPGTKHPPKGFKHWPDLGSTDPAVLARCWQQWPGANIGCVIPPQWIGIDMDPRNGGDIGWKNLLARHGALPATWRAWSGRQDGGFHQYLATPAGVLVPTITNLDQGVQILGPGHLLVVPPSLHPDTGEAYQWDAACNPFTLPVPAATPAWLLSLILDAPTKKSFKRTHGKSMEQQHGSRERGEGYAGESTKVPRDLKPPPGSLGDGPGKHLVARACEAKNLPALLEVCGLPSTLEVGYTTRCPFHDDQHPSASLLGPTEERHSYGLYCHAAACKRYYSLLDIFKARTSANLQSIHTETDSTGKRLDHGALRLQWLTRMLEAAGLLHLYELGAPSLPPNASEVEKEVFKIALHTRRVRSATRPASAPFPLSWRYVMDWLGEACEWGQYQIQKAKSRLIGRGVLEFDHEEQGITYWRIGSKALRRARRDAPILTTERANVESVDATPVPEPVAHTGHAWSAMASPTARVCPLAEEPGHDEATCVLWQAWLRVEEKKRLYGSPPFVELQRVGGEAT